MSNEAREKENQTRYPIEPVRWGGSRPSLRKVDQELLDRVHQDGPAALDKLRETVLDARARTERRYAAMGLLVALYNQGLLVDGDVLPVLDEVISSSSDKDYGQPQRDALGALASLSHPFEVGSYPGLSRLISIVYDPKSHENLRRDALLNLADRPHPMSVNALAWGVLDLRDRSDRFRLARALGQIPSDSWNTRAALFVRLLADSSKQRSDLDSGAVLHALRSEDEPLTRRLGALADFFIRSAVNADDRMAGNLAGLLVECVGGNPDQAGHAINLYERNHKLPETALRALRSEVGGAPALSGIVKVLKDDLDRYFQQPIHTLNEYTLRMWQDTLNDARRGLRARTWMSIAVFCLGVVLVLTASYTIIFPAAGAKPVVGTYMTVVAGLAIMLLAIYTGPLKEMRRSVTDFAAASAAFIAYVHRVLETSHTFSYYYLKETISFDEMRKSSALMTEAMNNTIHALSRKVIEPSQEAIDRAAELILKQRKNAH